MSSKCNGFFFASMGTAKCLVVAAEDKRKHEKKLKSAIKSAALLMMSASESAFFFFTGERERERVRFFGKERERVREIEERANALHLSSIYHSLQSLAKT